MSNFIDKFEIPTAVDSRCKLDLGHQHITTANFMQLNPVLCKEMVPGEKIDVNVMTYARMQPLAVPTFGRCNIKERAFFVEMNSIFRGWNDFITDTPHVFSGGSSKNVNIISQVPTVSNIELTKSFVTATIAGDTDKVFMLPASQTAYDVNIINTQGGNNYFRFTSYGRQWLKILRSLGYEIVWDERNTDTYSALPLMAFMKVVMDWYFPSQYVNTGLYADIMGALNYDGIGSIQIEAQMLGNFAAAGLYVNYDSDYFVSAWDNPVAPTNGVYSTFTIIDITTADNKWQSGSNSYVSKFGVSNSSIGMSTGYSTNGTPVSVMGFSAASSTVIDAPNRIGMTVSDYQHKALTALTEYLKRHQLSGARALDRYLARWGKVLQSEKEKRSNYISSKYVPLNINDVMSMSNTQSQEQTIASTTGLGSFSGSGTAFEKNFNFDWTTNEYGYLIVLTSIVPATGIWQGLDRKVMHKTKLDFFTPEFDGLGVQAISTRELYNTMKDTSILSNARSNYMSFDKSVFGFAPRYGEYKYCNDKLTGDFIVDTLNVNNANQSAWHMLRTFNIEDFTLDGSTYAYGNLVHNRAFVSGLDDHYQYNRIFQYYANNEMEQPDPFTMIYNFEIASFAPMKPLYDGFEFSEKGAEVPMQVNGVKAN